MIATTVINLCALLYVVVLGVMLAYNQLLTKNQVVEESKRGFMTLTAVIWPLFMTYYLFVYIPIGILETAKSIFGKKL